MTDSLIAHMRKNFVAGFTDGWRLFWRPWVLLVCALVLGYFIKWLSP